MAAASTLGDLQNEIFDLQEQIGDGAYLRIQNHLRDIHRQLETARALTQEPRVVGAQGVVRGIFSADDLMNDIRENRDSALVSQECFASPFGTAKFCHTDYGFGGTDYHRVLLRLRYTARELDYDETQVREMIDDVSNTPEFRKALTDIPKCIIFGRQLNIRSKFQKYPAVVRIMSEPNNGDAFNNLMRLILERNGFPPVVIDEWERVKEFVKLTHALFNELYKIILSIRALPYVKSILGTTPTETENSRVMACVESVAQRLTNEKRSANTKVYNVSVRGSSPSDVFEADAKTHRKNLGHIQFPSTPAEHLSRISSNDKLWDNAFRIPECYICRSEYLAYMSDDTLNEYFIDRLNTGKIHTHDFSLNPRSSISHYDTKGYNSFQMVSSEQKRQRKYIVVRRGGEISITFQSTQPVEHWSGV